MRHGKTSREQAWTTPVRHRRRLAEMLLLCAVAGAQAGDIGHGEARRLRREGIILPLGDLLKELAVRWPGRVIEAGLERDDGRYRYAIEILGDDGHVYEFEFEATSGKQLKYERER